MITSGFDANANDLSQDLEGYDDTDAWYNDDDIVSPKKEDVSQNPDSGEEENTQTSN